MHFPHPSNQICAKMPIVVPELESSSLLQVEDLIKKVFPKKVCVVKKAEKCLQSKKVLDNAGFGLGQKCKIFLLLIHK